jgi:hypothetical protein
MEDEREEVQPAAMDNNVPPPQPDEEAVQEAAVAKEADEAEMEGSRVEGHGHAMAGGDAVAEAMVADPAAGGDAAPQPAEAEVMGDQEQHQEQDQEQHQDQHQEQHQEQHQDQDQDQHGEQHQEQHQDQHQEQDQEQHQDQHQDQEHKEASVTDNAANSAAAAAAGAEESQPDAAAAATAPSSTGLGTAAGPKERESVCVCVLALLMLLWCRSGWLAQGVGNLMAAIFGSDDSDDDEGFTVCRDEAPAAGQSLTAQP